MHAVSRPLANPPNRSVSNIYVPYFIWKLIWNWSLIMGTGEGGGLQNGKIAGLKLFAPPLSKQVKSFHALTFKEWKLFAPPPLRFSMAKTLSFRRKTTLKLFLPHPPLSMAKLHRRLTPPYTMLIPSPRPSTRLRTQRGSPHNILE